MDILFRLAWDTPQGRRGHGEWTTNAHLIKGLLRLGKMAGTEGIWIEVCYEPERA